MHCQWRQFDCEDFFIAQIINAQMASSIYNTFCMVTLAGIILTPCIQPKQATIQTCTPP